MNQNDHTIIESIGVYLPPETFTTDEVLAACKNKFRFPLEKITGIQSRRMAGKHEFSIDLAKNAIADCLANSCYDPSDIDVLICCNISRFDGLNRLAFEPNTSVKLRQHFGFSHALVFDITNACAGMFTGIHIVNALIKSGAIRRGMVVSGEYITHLTETAQREIESFMDTRLACLTLGDAGAALIIEKATEPGTGFQAFDLQTFGRYSPYCIAKTSDQCGMIMYTDSLNLTETGMKSGAKHAMQTLQNADWPSDSFQHLIMHQTSGTTLNSARGEINRLLSSKVCHEGNTINNLAHRGNTASTAHFIALADHIRNNSIQSGDRIVFSITASGLTIGTALYVFDHLPDRLRQNNLTKKAKPVPSNMNGFGPSPNPANKRIRIESVGTIPLGKRVNKDTMEMLTLAAGDCIKKSSYATDDIGLLLYAGVYRSGYTMEPAYAALLAGALNMNAIPSATDDTKTLAFDIFNGSLGFLNACYVAQEMIAAKTCTTAMIVAAEIENNAETSFEERVGIRETASAIILDVDSSGTIGFSRFLFHYDDTSLLTYTTYFTSGEMDQHLVIEKAENLDGLYIAAILPAVNELLSLENLELHAIDIIFPPQISTSFITQLSAALGIRKEKFVDAAGDGPDLFSSSIPYSIQHAYEKKLVKPGDRGLIIAVGSGIQVGCAIYHF